MSLLDTAFGSGSSAALLAVFGDTVTYRISPRQPGGAAATGTLSAIKTHLPDLSPATAIPMQRARWEVRLVDVAAITVGEAPQRGDSLTDPDGNVWIVFDVLSPVGGMQTLFAKIAQVRA